MTSGKTGSYTDNLVRYLIVGAVCALGLILSSSSASAKTVYTWTIQPGATFHGADAVPATGANPGFRDIRIDQAANVLYAAYTVPVDFGAPSEERLYKFDLNGHSSPFGAFAPDTFLTKTPINNKFAVDNSSGSTQGRIYAMNNEFGGEELFAYLPSGEPYTGGQFPVKMPREGTTGGGACGVTVASDGNIWVSFFNFTKGGEEPNGSFKEFTPEGVPTGRTIWAEAVDRGSNTGMCDTEIDSRGILYNNTLSSFSESGHGSVARFDTAGVKHRGSLDIAELPLYTRLAVDPTTNDLFVGDGTTHSVRQYDPEGGFVSDIPVPGSPTGIAVDEDTHSLYVSQEGPSQIDKFVRSDPQTVPTALTTGSDVSPTAATLRGEIDADGIDTTECEFEWGPTTEYGNTAPCAEGNVFAADSGNQQVHAEIGGLTQGTEYHFRLVAENANNILSRGISTAFRAAAKPSVEGVTARNIDTGGAILESKVIPNGSVTHFQFEWGEEAGSYTHTLPADPHPPENALFEYGKESPTDVSFSLAGLTPETTYHFRFVATNDAGVTASADQVFRTFPKDPVGDSCPNAHVRQQTGTRLLFDCRAYELVSAANAGGYDVESDLAPDQVPLISSPFASNRVLYSLHFGSVPDIPGNPTDFGHDPYVAVRGAAGWTTEYVGLPTDGMVDQEPFGSPLLGTDADLRQFAFGGQDICQPCFADGSTNVPLRLADGSIVKGMAGTDPQVADPVGEVRRRFSADGTHFIFGSDKPFEANGTTGSVSIYSRNLQSDQTELVSTMPDGTTMAGSEIAELDVSSSGERVLIGKKVGEDPEGNEYFDLYMHIGSDPDSVEVAATPHGVLYDGMTSDGTDVYFTTADHATGDDLDESPDLFLSEVGTGGSASTTRVSTGREGAGNSDDCSPAEDWNVTTEQENCGVVAFAGGSGIASESGTVYFVSPELLDGPSNGVQDQANLYVAAPGGEPAFVATIDTSVGKPPPPPPSHPVNKAIFGELLNRPEAMSVDQGTGDLYVLDTTGDRLVRFGSSGAADDFGAGPGAGTNQIGSLSLADNSRSEVAVDNSGGSMNGDVYVTDGSDVRLFARSGEPLGDLDGSGTFIGNFVEPCGVAVDQADGTVYIGDHLGAVGEEEPGIIWQYTPTGSAPFDDSDYEVKALVTQGFAPCAVAADSSGDVYAAKPGGGPVRKFAAADFGSPGSSAGVQVAPSGTALAVDPSTDELYVNDGAQIALFSQGGGSQITTFGSGKLSASHGVAINQATKHSFAPNLESTVEFGYSIPLYSPIDQPGVLHGVHQPATHSFGDFQVSPTGRYALFQSTRSLTGYPTAERPEIYRYDAENGELDCTSCPPTGIDASTGATLSSNGLSLTDDGRVFFATREQLVLRDTNGMQDVYEWKDGEQQLISDGVGPQDSSLLTATADGGDVFFFTREILSHEDQNGNAVKIYDARQGGGFPFLPASKPCAASDECHGPGTVQPAAPDINTLSGGVPPSGDSGSLCAAVGARLKHAQQRAGRLRTGATKAHSKKRARLLAGRARNAERAARHLRREMADCESSH